MPQYRQDVGHECCRLSKLGTSAWTCQFGCRAYLMALPFAFGRQGWYRRPFQSPSTMRLLQSLYQHGAVGGMEQHVDNSIIIVTVRIVAVTIIITIIMTHLVQAPKGIGPRMRTSAHHGSFALGNLHTQVAMLRLELSQLELGVPSGRERVVVFCPFVIVQDIGTFINPDNRRSFLFWWLSR